MASRSLDFGSSSFAIVQHAEPEFLEAAFEKGLRKISQINAQAKSLTSDSQMAEDISVYALHYLVKGAKIPILNADNKSHQSYLEFISDSNPKYFRSQGGSIVTLYTHLMKLGAYQFLFDKYGPETKLSDSVQLVKSANFRHYLKMEYDYYKVAGRSDVSEMGPRLEYVKCFKPHSNTEKSILDVSSLLSDSHHTPVSPIELKARISELKNAIRENPNALNNVMICAFVQLEDGQTIFIQFNDAKLKMAAPIDEVEKLCKDQEEEIKEQKAHAGYFPDIIDVRRNILHQGITCEDFLQVYPLKARVTAPAFQGPLAELPNTSYHEVAGALHELREKITLTKEKDPENSAKQFYLSLFVKFIASIGTFVEPKEETYVLALVMSSLKEIDEIVDRISSCDSPEDHARLLTEVDLLTEEVVYLLTVLKPFDKTTLEERLNETGIKFNMKFAEKASYAFTSGMNGFSHVLGALSKQGQTTGQPLKIACATTSYFEFRLDVLPHLTKSFTPAASPIDPFKPITEDCDVFFMDLYPNEVTLPSVERVDPERVIADLLNNRAGNPLTVVIDTSTSLFSSQDIQEIVDRFNAEINNGRLNLVVVNSLAKFSMCGLDKYTGGVVQTYNNTDKFKVFNQHMIKRQSQEKLSPEADRFFNLFFSCAPEFVERYLSEVNHNTETLYQSLTTGLQCGLSAMHLAEKKSDRIPMISFQFDNVIKALASKIDPDKQDQAKANMSILMQYYIYARAKALGLPMDTRTSFGFAHSNINECWIALRLTVGLETPDQLELYKQLFLEVNAELQKVMNDPLFLKLITTPGDGFYYEAFKQFQKRQIILAAIPKGGDGMMPYFEKVDSELIAVC
ncbi:MAG: hypothetical protein JSR39_06400 [Verrucomicrobia bacterium]|nr:hypothetical protein [Verrucomicrobiota bacterium]